MDTRRHPAQLGLEDLTCRLPREHPHERAERVVSSGINDRRRVATRVWRNSSSSSALSASSFGHDTPAHIERRFVVRGRSWRRWMGGTECGSERAVVVLERGRCVRRSDRASWWAARSESICLNQNAVGTKPSSVIPKRSTSDDVEECLAARARCSEHTPRRECCQRRSKPRPSRTCRLERRAGGVNARRPCGRHGRSV